MIALLHYSPSFFAGAYGTLFNQATLLAFGLLVGEFLGWSLTQEVSLQVFFKYSSCVVCLV